MTATLEAPATNSTGTFSVVLCGSFRRDQEGLAAIHEELRSRFDLLSPLGLDFTDPSAEFVRLPHETHQSVGTIEDGHLAAITRADCVWLHAPDGYVGSSGAMELGHARALGIPVFSSVTPNDPTLAAYVTVVDGIGDITDLLGSPGRALAGLQEYYRRVSRRRGWDSESPQDTMLMLTEELGELARAVRHSVGLARDGSYTDRPLGHEIADVQLYLVHLANAMGVDIAAAVTDKERLNAERFMSRGATKVA